MTLSFAPEVLIFTTTDPDFGQDDVLVSRSTTGDAVAFIQLAEDARYNGRVASAFLSLSETMLMRDQLNALIQDALTEVD